MYVVWRHINIAPIEIKDHMFGPFTLVEQAATWIEGIRTYDQASCTYKIMPINSPEGKIIANTRGNHEI